MVHTPIWAPVGFFSLLASFCISACMQCGLLLAVQSVSPYLSGFYLLRCLVLLDMFADFLGPLTESFVMFFVLNLWCSLIVTLW